MSEKYLVIPKPDPVNGPFVWAHDTLEQAVIEAERVSIKYNTNVIVAEVRGYCRRESNWHQVSQGSAHDSD